VDVSVENSWNLNLALLMLRFGVAYVFLYAAWKNTENTAAWSWTVNETAILFRRWPDAQREVLARICAVAGMVMMYGGGASVLLGLEPRIGGFLIAAFSIMGTWIHAIRRDEAKQVAESGNMIGWSAYSAHIAAGLKNWALVGAGLVFVLVGAGQYGLQIDYIARIVGWQ
jgi:uncharacterized membrane protein YphA (DoxX/SURF4 family)